MAERKPFLLRIDRDVLDAMQRWANDDLRSLNGQIEFVLRDALKRAGRARQRRADSDAEGGSNTDSNIDSNTDSNSDAARPDVSDDT